MRNNQPVVQKYLDKTKEDAQHLFQRLYKEDWAFFYNHWKNGGIEPNRVRIYCETELSRMVIQELRRGHVRPY